MTETTTALEAYKPQSLTDYQKLGEIISRSKMFADVTDEAKAVIRVMAGAELGFAPIYSLTKISLVKGRIAIGYEAMAAKIKASERYDYLVKEWDNEKCTLEWTDNGTRVLENTFTMTDAKEAGLVKPDSGWVKWKKAMLFSKALSQGARVVCPHVISGAYTMEDFGKFSDDTENVIEAEVTEIPQEQPVEDEGKPITKAEFNSALDWMGCNDTDRILELLGLTAADDLKKRYSSREGILDALGERLAKDWRKRVDLETGEVTEEAAGDQPVEEGQQAEMVV